MKNNIDINNIPNKMGVYLFKENDEILYVGKAKNIKKRIQQYFRGSTNSYKTPHLIERANDIEYIICSNEKESLLLEQELIKKYHPYFNILLLDDKKYPYIVIELKSNKIEFKTRFFYKKETNSYYYGPLPPSYGYKTIKNFLIRECLYKDGLPIQSNDPNFWKKQFEYAKKILSSSNGEIIKKLKKQMIECSENEQYELAQEFRDIIIHLSNKEEKQSIKFETDKNIDVISFETKEKYLIVTVHNFKNGSFFMQENHLIEILFNVHDTIVMFLNEFYNNRNLPDLIVTNENIDTNEINFQTKILVPKKGKYLQAIENAKNNGNLNYEQKVIQLENKNNIKNKINDFLQKTLQKRIKDILMIDNSNESNQDIVSVLIFYRNLEPIFSNFRKYKIDETKIKRLSDVEYIKIGLTKYFEHKNSIPDLLIVDGAIQQLKEAKKVIEKFKIDIPIIGLVKDDNHKTKYVILENHEKIVLTDKDIFNFFSRIQFEVDKYAKKYHSSVKIKSSLEGSLSLINGIGKNTEDKLLTHFKTYSNIFNAPQSELEKVVSKRIAKKIIENIKK